MRTDSCAYSRLRYSVPPASCTVRITFHGNPAGTSQHNCPNEPKPPLPHHHGWVSAINLPYILYPSKVTWKLNLRRWDSFVGNHDFHFFHVRFPTSRWRLYNMWPTPWRLREIPSFHLWSKAMRFTPPEWIFKEGKVRLEFLNMGQVGL